MLNPTAYAIGIRRFTKDKEGSLGIRLTHIVGKMGDENYEYGVCPTLEIKCQWPIQAVHFSYEITFQKVK